MLFTTLLIAALWAQFWLAFVCIVVPNAFNSMYIISYGAARLVEEKCASSKTSFPLKSFLVISLVSFLDGHAYFFATLVDLFGRLFHSYRVVGLENIPLDRPALLIYYHGVMPLDMQYLPIRLFLKSGRVIRTIADRFLFFIPIWRLMVRNYIFPGPATKCLSTLKNGHLLQISPGGTREALFATFRYETVWNKRTGFARVAKEAGVDIIPVFTRNIRQMFYIPELVQPLLRPLYERLRLPVMPIIGGFPVQLTTFVGKPIPCDSADSVEELAALTRKAIEELIELHQTFPATISSAIGERFVTNGKTHLD